MSVPPESATTPPAASAMPSAEERQWAMFAHLSALIGFIIPFGSIIAPLIIWQMKKETMPFVDEQGKEALNFQITVAIAVLACFALMLILIGFLLLWLVGIAALILVVIAAIRANNGEHYRYPFALRLVN
ncbi:orotate phosphoribosyltransferase [Mizugakiibacter sediminis]|uniref:Orotate phosphoribosyltransferase n=1 Tax=Mizugakiibacter sediminis TaxID=1475481 RepID=A0A0K8QP66_9GAMM|nr:DUF4870 domain-containing protein [Mizugakiibacter sediminis]GAP66521.1 orotate phosphoribosyltransferase [Mizugakiibacter sediminis]